MPPFGDVREQLKAQRLLARDQRRNNRQHPTEAHPNHSPHSNIRPNVAGMQFGPRLPGVGMGGGGNVRNATIMERLRALFR